MLSLPKDDLDKQKVLEKVMKKFDDKRTYNSSEVSKILRSFDVDDFVLFRRELVNFGYLSKDSYRDSFTVIKKSLSREDLENIKILSSDLDKISD